MTLIPVPKKINSTVPSVATPLPKSDAPVWSGVSKKGARVTVTRYTPGRIPALGQWQISTLSKAAVRQVRFYHVAVDNTSGTAEFVLRSNAWHAELLDGTRHSAEPPPWSRGWDEVNSYCCELKRVPPGKTGEYLIMFPAEVEETLVKRMVSELKPGGAQRTVLDKVE